MVISRNFMVKVLIHLQTEFVGDMDNKLHLHETMVTLISRWSHGIDHHGTGFMFI